MTLQEAAEYAVRVARKMMARQMELEAMCPSLADLWKEDAGPYCLSLHGPCEFVRCDDASEASGDDADAAA